MIMFLSDVSITVKEVYSDGLSGKRKNICFNVSGLCRFLRSLLFCEILIDHTNRQSSVPETRGAQLFGDPRRVKTFAVFCLVIWLALTVLYHPDHGCGIWGLYGILSIPVSTYGGCALNYFLIYISLYTDHWQPARSCLPFMGSHSLDILMLHFGIAEMLTMVFSFISIQLYTGTNFALSHIHVVVILIWVIMIPLIGLKDRLAHR